MSEIVTPSEALAADLAPLARLIAAHSHLISQHEAAAAEATLEPRLLIGQAIAKAKHLFGMTVQEAGKLGGRPSTETLLRRGMVSTPDPLTLGFHGWLCREAPTVKRQTAEKYAKAYLCLALPLDAKPTAIREAVKTLRHNAGAENLTLAAIIREAAPKVDKSQALIIPGPPDTAELRLGDARVGFFKWREAFDSMVNAGMLDDLDKPALLELQEFQLHLRDRLKARLK